MIPRRRTSPFLSASACAIAVAASTACSDNADSGSATSSGTSAAGTGASTTSSTSSGPATGGASTSSSSTSSASGGAGGGVPTDPTTCAEAAAAKTSIGCDFWPTVVANQVWSIFDYAVVVANASPTQADVKVERGGAVAAQASVPPNGSQILYLPWVPELKGPDASSCAALPQYTTSLQSTGGAYHLTSTAPITAYQYSAIEWQPSGGPNGKSWAGCPADQCGIPCMSYSNSASLLIPTTAMTGTYRITAQSGWVAANVGSYFAVTATVGNTNVTIHLSATAKILAGGSIVATSPGGTYQTTMGAGDVLEFFGDAMADPSGTLVQASAPVQVIAGMPCVDQPFTAQACDHIEETVFPAETLGKHYFVTVPTSPHGATIGHIVRLYGNVDATTLTYPGTQPAGAPASLAAGQVVDLGQVASDFEVVGDHEFAVASFSLGGSLVDPNAALGMQEGDPDQTHVVPVEQYRTTYRFVAASSYEENFADIVMPVGAKVVLDGTLVAAPTETIGSGFGIARVPLAATSDAHVVTSSDPISVQVSGYGVYTGIMFPAGLNLKAIAPAPTK